MGLNKVYSTLRGLSSAAAATGSRAPRIIRWRTATARISGTGHPAFFYPGWGSVGWKLFLQIDTAAACAQDVIGGSRNKYLAGFSAIYTQIFVYWHCNFPYPNPDKPEKKKNFNTKARNFETNKKCNFIGFVFSPFCVFVIDFIFLP